MEQQTIGFIGAGNMASAIISGIIRAGAAEGSRVMASDPDAEKRTALEQAYGIRTGDNRQVAESSRILFLAVKPAVYGTVIPEIRDSVREDTIVVSIAPGQTLDAVRRLFGGERKLIRVMPNTPALVGEGMSAVCANDNVSPDELDTVCGLCRSFGRCVVVPESMMHAVVGVSGSSPAYAFLFLEALADAAVMKGMPRPLAYECAAQALAGSAKMVLETGKHPGELKDMVCSPGGTTIEAVAVLEQRGFRSAVIDAAAACADKSEKMERE